MAANALAMPIASEAQRDADECTVTLEVADAELVSAEVDAGDHQTFDDALHYIIERGVAEIARQRKSHAKSAAQRQALGALRQLLGANPNAAGVLPDQLVAAMKAAGLVK